MHIFLKRTSQEPALLLKHRQLDSDHDNRNRSVESGESLDTDISKYHIHLASALLLAGHGPTRQPDDFESAPMPPQKVIANDDVMADAA